MDKDLQIFEVNLAVSNVCNASCLFCPRSFVTHENKFMSVETVERIMAEVSTPEFKSEHPVVHSVPSENGEPFLNPNILDILRIIRKAGLYITLFTNFGLIDEEISKTLIGEHLTDNINVNIDGISEASYRAVKGIDLKMVEDNLKRFIVLRDAADCSIHIFGHVISHYTYTKAVKMVYGKPPVKGNGYTFLQDGPQTVEKWQKIINPKYDNIGEDSVMFWVERYNDKPIAPLHGCPNIGRVRHVAYINPDGDWYACCFDAGNDLVVGNVLETSILEVSQSQNRKDLIDKLEGKRYNEIGWPCTRVDACGGVNRSMIQ